MIRNNSYDWNNEYPLIRVTYYDHCWLDNKDIEKIKEKAKPYILEEFGYLLKETAEYYVICRSISFDGEKKLWEFDHSFVVLKTTLVKPIQYYIKC